MPAATKKNPSQLDALLNTNPALRKEFERRIKTARVQAASLAEESKEHLRSKLVEAEIALEKSLLREDELLKLLKLREVSEIAGDGNPALGEVKIENTKLRSEVENLKIALKDLHRTYAKLVNEKSKPTR